MTLPASGNITLQNLATEFETTLPKSLTDFYKGGALVPNIAANASVPTSGTITLQNFYGARRYDKTPDAVSWADASTSTISYTTADQTISGIEVAITLRITYADDLGLCTVSYSINGGSFVALASSGDTFSVSNGQTLKFRVSRGGRPNNVSVLIENASDSYAAIDGIFVTFT